MRSGRAPCLANTDAHAGEQELNKVLCEAAGSGETAPNDHGKAQYTDPIAALRPARNRKSRDAIEQREGYTRHHAEFPIRQLELGLSRPSENSDELANEKVYGIANSQNGTRVTQNRKQARW